MMDKPLRLSDFKALTFDVGGTLIDIESGILNWFRPHLVRHHLEISDSTLLEAFAQAEEKYLNLLPQISFTRILPVVYREIAESCGLTPREADGEEFMQSVQHWPAFADSVSALQELRKHFLLVAVTNADSEFFRLMNQTLGDPFDLHSTCDEVGCNKPDLRVFQHMLAKLEARGIERHQVLHVAQSQFHDLIPATQLGLRTVWLKRRQDRFGFGATPVPAELVSPARTITDLHMLSELHQEEQQQHLLLERPFSLKVRFVHDLTATVGAGLKPVPTA